MTSIDVLAIAVHWSDGYCNDPSLKFLVSESPDDLVYEKRPCDMEISSSEQTAIVGARHRRKRKGWHLYWSETDGFVWFFTWGGKPDDGFGGWRRTIKLTDGTEEEIVGGWHTSPDAAEDVGFPRTLDVSVVKATDVREGQDWARTGGLARFITAERAEREVARLRPDLEWVPNWSGRGLTVKWRGQPSKDEWSRQAPNNERRNQSCVDRGDVYSALGPAVLPDAA